MGDTCFYVFLILSSIRTLILMSFELDFSIIIPERFLIIEGVWTKVNENLNFFKNKGSLRLVKKDESRTK